MKLVATLAVLVGVFRLSRRQVQYFARTFFGVELVRQHERLGGGPGGLRPTGEGRSPSGTKLALGTISKLEQEASDALAPVYTEALDAARASEAAFVDETSWQMKHRTHWLWVMVTGVASVFMIHARRNTLAAKALLGGFAGNLVTDRCASYLNAIEPKTPALLGASAEGLRGLEGSSRRDLPARLRPTPRR
ncbi:MAG: transposase [Myxococcales bacterium]|nr:transposase [Myxococcales bacterium]